MATPYDGFLRVTDLKQYTHCPRVTYYEHCLPNIRPRTYKMDAGKLAHEQEQKRAIRRSLRQYAIMEGERSFDVYLRSETLRLTGELDEIVTGSDGAHIPIDYKLAKKAGTHHRLQLTAYALMLEETTQQTIPLGYIYLIPKREAVKVSFTDRLRQKVLDTIEAIHQMLLHEQMPSTVPPYNYCVACEFRRFCNDVQP